ncbi:MAG: hypothetical protein EOO05_13460 [Chitinophagaceae bacterium]|nr:MAG: hypothetical protein EOO05_13460 [Chitinophagaceae bacterium]
MRKIAWIFCLLSSLHVSAQRKNYSIQMADAAVSTWIDSTSILSGKTDPSKMGILLFAMEAVWNATGNGQYFNYINKSVDQLVQSDGSIKKLQPGDASMAAQMLMVYEVTKKDRYRKAAELVVRQSLPGKGDAGLPTQTALRLAQSIIFNVAYSQLFQSDSSFSALSASVISLTGRTLVYEELPLPGFAFLSSIDKIPGDPLRKQELVHLFQAYAKKTRALQDTSSGKWPSGGKTDAAGEYATTALIAYTFAKGVRMGYLEEDYLASASKAYAFILKQFRGAKGAKDRGAADKSGGTETIRESFMGDPSRVGSFILAATEMEMLETATAGKGKKVVLDYYYNNEWQKDVTGKDVRWHYTWEDRSNSGYHMLGHVFMSNGAKISRLETSAADLAKQKASLYIIVDPDTEKETAKPHFIEQADITHIKKWVGDGGVLLLLGNDKGNAEFTHLNELAASFGIHFNEDKQNTVIDDMFEQGVVMSPAGSAVFGTQAKKLFIKEFSSLALQSPAEAVLTKGDIKVMALSKYGNGWVVALGDPWIYNEYIDGRKLTTDFQNYPATVEWVKWMLSLSKKTSLR